MSTLDPTRSYRMHAPKGSNRRAGLLSAYDISITVPGASKIEVGRFSHGAIGRFEVYSLPAAESIAEVCSIGAFCEFSASTKIILGSDHQNENLFNATLANGGGFYKDFMSEIDKRLSYTAPSKRLIIRDGVSCSTSTLIFDGSDIGAGCVVGAGAFVRRKLEPFGIYGGVPAKRLADRFSIADQQKYNDADFANVAAHAVPILASTALAYQKSEITFAEMRARLPRMTARPKLHATATVTGTRSFGPLSFKGYSVGDGPVHVLKEHKTLDDYFLQIGSPDETVEWYPDIFLALGLTSTVSV